jgi:hypothetical protein
VAKDQKPEIILICILLEKEKKWFAHMHLILDSVFTGQAY